MTYEKIIRYSLRLARKDLLIELRRAHEFMSILAFAITSILISSFAWRGILVLKPETVSATLWIVIYFSSILTLTTSFSREVDRGTLAGLRSLPCPTYTILIGKIIYGSAILFTVLITTILSAIIFLNLEISSLLSLWLIFSIGVVDLALVGSMISAIVMYSEGKILLLSFLFFPVSVPVLIPGTQAVSRILSGAKLIGILPEFRLLLSFLLAIIAISIIIFRFIFIE